MNALQPRDVDVPGVVAMLVLGLGLLDLFLDVLPWVPFYVVFIVGFAVVLPLAGILFDDEEETVAESGPDPEPDVDPLAELRRRYAEGEIDELEFERRLERLLETEDEATAREYAERLRRDRETGRGSDHDGERERDADRETDRESA